MIGEHPNKQVVQNLQASNSPFEAILIPENLVPKLKLPFGVLIPLKTNELITSSGFPYQSSIFTIGILIV